MANCCPPFTPAGWLAVCALPVIAGVCGSTNTVEERLEKKKKHKMVAVVVSEWEGSPLFLFFLFLCVLGGSIFRMVAEQKKTLPSMQETWV